MTRQGARILVVDDEPDMARNLALILRGAGHEPIVESRGARALELIERESFDLVVTDLRMPEVDGLALLDSARKLQAGLPVIMVTGYASIDSAVEAMKKGATDYLAKPFPPDELVLRVERALAWTRLREENRYLRDRVDGSLAHAEIVGRSAALADVMRTVQKVAATDARVLVSGESGTGKELIARTIHRWSSRAGAPFCPVNCGALTESILESELFGHERGAFTGAVATKKGIFEVADGGTLLLDEIGETSLAFQTKLLRVVQEGEFQRVGGSRALTVDVRMISSTNRDLRRAISEGRFREDLYYRLGVVQVNMPALRDRREDIPLLVEHFLRVYSSQIKRKVHRVHADTMEVLRRYRWPGNIRELENIVERAVIMVDDGDEILPEHLPVDLLEERPPIEGPMDEVRSAERDVIIRTLRESNWNRSEAAKRLGIGRRTLYEKLGRLGISLHPSP